MALPEPVPGLVIGFSHLWRDEALRRLEEGRKDRPCVIILAAETQAGRKVVTVAPITHSPPIHPDSAVEIPVATQRRLGLDCQRSWIVAADLNQFAWPGADLRPVRRGADTCAYGLLPDILYRRVRDQVLALARARRAALTPRSQ